MQTCYDRVMIRPSGLELVSALTEAQAAANAGPRLALTYEDWLGVAAEARGEAEGFREWDVKRHGRISGVALVWWTDHVGRRHFRVQAAHEQYSFPEDGAYPITSGHPPVWFFSGSQCFRVGTEWVVACACGAFGPPGRIGWMGTLCAACHDLRQKGQEPPRRVLVGPVPEYQWQPAAQAPADTRYTISVEDDNRLMLWRNVDNTLVLDYPFTASWERIPNQSGCSSYAFLSEDERTLVLVTPRAHVFRLDDGQWRLTWTAEEVHDWWDFSPGDEMLIARPGGTANGPALYSRDGVRMEIDPVPSEPGWNVNCFEAILLEGATLLVTYRNQWREAPAGGDILQSGFITAWRREGQAWRLIRHEALPRDVSWPVFDGGSRWVALPGREGASFLDVVSGHVTPPIARFNRPWCPSGVGRLYDEATFILHEPGGTIYVPWRLLLGLGPP